VAGRYPVNTLIIRAGGNGPKRFRVKRSRLEHVGAKSRSFFVVCLRSFEYGSYLKRFCEKFVNLPPLVPPGTTLMLFAGPSSRFPFRAYVVYYSSSPSANRYEPFTGEIIREFSTYVERIFNASGEIRTEGNVKRERPSRQRTVRVRGKRRDIRRTGDEKK